MTDIDQLVLDEQWTYVGHRHGPLRNSIWITTVISNCRRFSHFILGSRSSESIDLALSQSPLYNSSVSDNFSGYHHLENHSCEGKRAETNLSESWNMRIRHYLARMKRQSLCYSKSTEMLLLSLKFLWVKKFWNINL